MKSITCPIVNVEYKKGQEICRQNEPAQYFCKVIAGLVKVSCMSDNGNEVVVDVYRADEFFGLSALAKPSQRGEQAIALTEAMVEFWAVDDLMANPKQAVPLLQVVVERNIELQRRIVNFATGSTSSRLARALIRFSERFGTVEDDASVRMMPFTHALLAQYVGTTREIVTNHMNTFRRQGYLKYSRQEIVLCPGDLAAWIKKKT